jgi:hypothetical protein
VAPVYSLATINARLQAVVNQIDANGNGFIKLLSNSTVISTVQLQRPSGIISGGVLTFVGTLLDPSAAATGGITTGRITDGIGTIVVSGLTVGVPTQTADIVIFNGLGTTTITTGQVVQILAAQITGI